MAGIELINIHKRYWVENRTVKVLNGISLHIPENQITVVLGRSGCGKTTLLRLTGGLEKADQGEIRYGESHKTAFVFQEPRLMPWLTVWNNITFGLSKREQDRKKIADIITTAGLTGFERAYPAQLSGGMQQRTAIARALAYEPSFIMMDEPFAALDYFTREQMQQELLRVQEAEHCSILFVTHSMDDAARIADRLIVFHEGGIAMDGTPDEVFSRARELTEMGLDVPQPAAIAAALRERGAALPESVYTAQQLHEAVLALLRKGGRD